VWLRALTDTNRQPVFDHMFEVEGVHYKVLRHHHDAGEFGTWHGFSWNPGLRRRREYDLLGSFTSLDPNGLKQTWEVESAASEFYQKRVFPRRFWRTMAGWAMSATSAADGVSPGYRSRPSSRKLCCDVQSSLLCNYISGQSILAGLRRDQMAGLEPNPDAFPVPPDLAVAQESLERFRFVGLVEDFQEDVLRLSLELGLHPPQPLPKRNFDPESGGGLNTIAPETLATIRERNPVDVALYERVKARLAKRPRASRDAVGHALLTRGIYRPIAEPVAFAMTGPMPAS
jgi:hypothetical protein